MVPLIQQLNAQTDEWRALEIARAKNCWFAAGRRHRHRARSPVARPDAKMLHGTMAELRAATPMRAQNGANRLLACSCAQLSKPGFSAAMSAPAPFPGAFSLFGAPAACQAARNQLRKSCKKQPKPMKPFLRSQLALRAAPEELTFARAKTSWPTWRNTAPSRANTPNPQVAGATPATSSARPTWRRQRNARRPRHGRDGAGRNRQAPRPNWTQLEDELQRLLLPKDPTMRAQRLR